MSESFRDPRVTDVWIDMQSRLKAIGWRCVMIAFQEPKDSDGDDGVQTSVFFNCPIEVARSVTEYVMTGVDFKKQEVH